MSKFKDISLATIVRTLCLAFALFNQVLSACGHPMIPLDNAQMEQFLTSVITVIAALVSWWRTTRLRKKPLRRTRYTTSWWRAGSAETDTGLSSAS